MFFLSALLLAALANGQTPSEVLPADFYLDVNGISVAVGHDHICALQREEGVDIGGSARCWGRNDYKKCKAPKEVGDPKM
jgi:hypothetical protein